MNEIKAYLAVSGGYPWNFTNHLAAWCTVGYAFISALNTWDIYQLREAGLYDPLLAENDPESPLILNAIFYLREQNHEAGNDLV